MEDTASARPALARWLPRGGQLPADVWARRHRTVLSLLWAHVPFIFFFGIVRGFRPLHMILETGAVAVPAALATFPAASRRVRSAVATVGLVTSSAVLVHLSGGLIEMHFHFFVIVGVLTVYEDWFPFLLSILYVVIHHGYMGAVDPRSVYNHPAAWRNPWLWGGIHGVFVLAASAASVVAWRRNEEARNQVHGSHRDVASSEARLHEAQVLAHIGSWSLDIGSGDLSSSPELRSIYRRPGLTWQYLREAVDPGDRSLTDADLDAALVAGAPFDIEHRILTPDGETRWVHSRGSAERDASGAVVGLHGTAQDITERKTLDGLLAESYRREQAAAEVLRAADEMKNDFLRALSHDLRAPLTVVSGAAELLARRYDDLSPDQAKDMLSRLAAQARRLHAIFTDLLDLERLTSGSAEPQREPVDLLALVRRVASGVERRGRTIDIQGGHVVAQVDRVHVERIVDNLITNAVKHTPEGTQVHVRVLTVDGYARITVSDEGPGIPEHLRDQIFEPFRRGDTPAAGTGIGLSLVAKFAELHGGRAWVEDAPGGGASFVIVLPDEGRVGSPLANLARQTSREQ